ncbi:unnamed protein product [Pneumocystis jirovecii]|uniref:Uncharacterized protein n=1 Tax=Pneumocystis jirovecii TaxID=42068 RepID=L0PG90_PNEJI|nr:unnamed protein product [Pneumocystis jirovecii]
MKKECIKLLLSILTFSDKLRIYIVSDGGSTDNSVGITGVFLFFGNGGSDSCSIWSFNWLFVKIEKDMVLKQKFNNNYLQIIS